MTKEAAETVGHERTMGSGPTRFISPASLQQETGLPRDFIYNALRDGLLPHIRRGRSYLVLYPQVLDVLEKLAQGGHRA